MKTLDLPNDVFDKLAEYARAHSLSEAEAMRVAVPQLVEADEEKLTDEAATELREALAAYNSGEPTLGAEEVQEQLGLPRPFPVGK